LKLVAPYAESLLGWTRLRQYLKRRATAMQHDLSPAALKAIQALTKALQDLVNALKK